MQPYPSGEPHRVTPDLLEYRNVSVRADGSSFVSVGLDAAYSLWRIPLQGRSPQRIASERYDGLLGIAPLPDGRTIVSSGERGNTQLALIDREGCGPSDSHQGRNEHVAGGERRRHARSRSCRIATVRPVSGE